MQNPLQNVGNGIMGEHVSGPPPQEVPPPRGSPPQKKISKPVRL